VPIVAVGFWMAWHWSLIESGGRELLAADRSWLLAALAATVLGWVAVSFSRQGTVIESLPAVRLFAAHFAAGAASHLLPAGLGAGAVNLRFFQRCGLPAARSTAALARSVDAAPVMALVTVGASVTLATSVVLGFRIITVWMPLAPGALTLGALVRWKVV
jgi:uncharacterized membrane protein YbhN (UPF0104 family)